jgi:hypothetical protein
LLPERSAVGSHLGGGIIDFYSTVTVENSTLSGNSASYSGGGMYASEDRVELTNALIAGNTSSQGPDYYGVLDAGSSHNIIGDGTGMYGISNGDANGNLVGVTKPLLGPLGNYGGPTQTMALLPGSPAIDVGASAGAPATDQRGLPRSGTPDIGAYEVQPLVTLTAPVNGSLTNQNETTLSAASVDHTGTNVVSVQFQYSSDGGASWTNAGFAQTASPFSYSFTSPLPDGVYEARAIGTDSAGNSAASAPVTFTIDTVAPTVTLTAPADGSTTENRPTLAATAADNSGGSGLKRVQFQYSSDGGASWTNAGPAETAAPFRYTFTTALAQGAYEARAIATDNAGNSTTSAPVSFTVGPTTYWVTTTADGGPGSLQWAIQQANADDTGTAASPDVIAFNLPGNDPNHYYYFGIPSLTNIAQVPAVPLDGVTPITSDAQLADPTLVGAYDTIASAWPHSWWTIPLINPLPPVTDIMTIDGYTQPGASPNSLADGDNAILRIQLDGGQLLPSYAALTLSTGTGSTGGSTVRGLNITTGLDATIGLPGNGAEGIWLKGGGNNHIEGNFIGPDISGLFAANLGNATAAFISNPHGIVISDGAQGNVIGTNGISDPGSTQAASDAARRNLISGNNWGVLIDGDIHNSGGTPPYTGTMPPGGYSGHDIIAGNFIGTDSSGARVIGGDPGGAAPNGPRGSTTGTAPGNWAGIGLERNATGDQIGTDLSGDDAAGMRNVISGNKFGVLLAGGGFTEPAAVNCLVAGNYIGATAQGLDVGTDGNSMGNWAAGVAAGIGAQNCHILANVIANTTGYAYSGVAGSQVAGVGVAISSLTRQTGYPQGIRVEGNSIYGNSGLGIDLGMAYPPAVGADAPLPNGPEGTGPNKQQHYPVLESAQAVSTTITGTFSSLNPGPFTLDFYANTSQDPTGYGQGKLYLGSARVSTDPTTGMLTGSPDGSAVITTDSSGNPAFVVHLQVPTSVGEWISATATDANGDTSEFSGDLAVSPRAVYWTGAAGDGNWDTAGNWSINAVPGPNDAVTIDNTYEASPFTVTHSAGTDSVYSLTVSGGASLAGTANLDVTGLLKLDNGRLDTSGTTTAEGGLEMDNNSELANGRLAVTGSVNATGTAYLDNVGVTSTGDQNYGGDVTATGTASLSGANVRVSGAVTARDSYGFIAGTFNVNSGGNTAFLSSIATGHLQVHSGGATSFGGDVGVGGWGSSWVTSDAGDTTFSGALTTHELITVTSGGKTTFTGAVTALDAYGNPNGSLSVRSGGDTLFASAAAVSHLQVHSGGATSFRADVVGQYGWGSSSVASGGDTTFAGALTTHDPFTVTSQGKTTFAGAVTALDAYGNPNGSLGVDSRGGDTVFASAVAVSHLQVHSAGATSFGGDVTGQYGWGSSSVASDGGDTTFSGGLTTHDPFTVTSHGKTSFAGAVVAMDAYGNPYGSLTVSSGADTAFASAITAGSVGVQSGGQTAFGGAVAASGTLNVTSTGAISLALGASCSANQAVFNGPLALALAGTNPVSQYNQVSVASAATRSGALTVTLAGGFTPQVGEQFTILQAPGTGSVSGTFAGLADGAYLSAGVGVFRIDYQSGGVVLTYVGNQLVVTNTNDAGVGSLRAAVGVADQASPGVSDTITFAIPTTDRGYNPATGAYTITLGSALPALSDDVAITGPGADVLAVSGAGQYQVFSVSAGVTAGISGLTIENGYNASSCGGISNAGTLALSDCVVSGNRGSYGGGIYNGGTLSLSDSLLTGNSALLGAGIQSYGSLTMTRCTVSGNTATAAGGGGIENDGGTTTLIGCTLSGNSAAIAGGIYNSTRATLIVIDSTLRGNLGHYYGGGIVNDGGTLTVTASTLSGNITDGYAGGILNGGVYTNNTGTVDLGDSIVAGNAASTNPDVQGTVTSQGYNLVKAIGSSSGYIGSDQLGVDPLLAPLGNYGGPSQTMALLAGSPARGTGDPTAAGLPATDQRGFARVVGGRVNIGAFQTQAVPFAVNTTADAGRTPGKLALREAMNLANAVGGNPTITFAIPTTDPGYNPTTGAFTIQTLSALPVASGPVVIDGTTEPGYAGTPIIVLNGSQAGSGTPINL